MAAAIATAAGVIGAAYIGSRAANKSTKAQLSANDQAMAYQREQDSKAEGEQARRREDRLQAVRDWYATYGEEGIKRWGPPRGISLAELRGGTGKQVSTGGHGGGGNGVTTIRNSPTMADLGSMTTTAGSVPPSVTPVAETDQFAAALQPRRHTIADLTAYGAPYA